VHLHFNETKATQAASRFLTLEGGKMQYIKLIKLLYLLDRAALLKWGRPVTTDRYISMAYGPVVHNVYELIIEPRAVPNVGEIWRRHISPKSHFLVRLVKDPGVGELSRAEEKLIVSIFKKFGAKHWSELVEFSHTFAEWRIPGTQKATQIDVRDILKAGNYTAGEIAEVERDLESLAVVEGMISE
jgi:uncharacterized phage-associated protein